MKICVLGTGYVGLVGAAVFADWGNDVVGLDIMQEKIDMINAGKMPIYEPGLEELVAKGIKSGKLKFTTKYAEAVPQSELVFICVGTPSNQSGAADLSYVWAAAAEVAKHMKKYTVVITKSTVPVGTNEEVKRIVKANAPEGVDFDVASCPEFLREGYSIEDSYSTDRTVVGSDSPKAISMVKKVYEHLGAPIVECDLRSAEMIKYASNAFLATKISFVNEIGQICERAGADVVKVAEGMGLDKRIGPRFLQAGLGYGGSCFPKDVEALYRTSTDQAYDFRLLRGVMDVNEAQRLHFVSKIKRILGGNLSHKTIGCYGLAFKENTDDTRKSVAIEVIKLLRGEGAKIQVYDPIATANAKKELGVVGIEYVDDPYKMVDGTDALCILTEWKKEILTLDFNKVGKAMNDKIIFDGRNVLDPQKMKGLGFRYFAVGRGSDGWSYDAKNTNGNGNKKSSSQESAILSRK